MREIVFGDVHGCIEEFDELLHLLDLRPDDNLYSLGDLCHKGPDSAAVVRRFRELKTPRWFIHGNHEEKQLRWLEHERMIGVTGEENPIERDDGFAHLDANLSSADIEFLKNSYLCLSFHAGPKKYILIHGGISSRLKVEVLNGTLISELESMSIKARKQYMRLLRLRYEDPDGRMVSMGEETLQDVFWAERYNGRYGTAIFGHQPFFHPHPRYYPHAIGMDTGCVHGGHLTALIIDSDTGTHSYVSVAAKKEYIPIKKIMARFPT